MPKFDDYAISHLKECGMDDPMARRVFARFISHETQEPMRGRWQEDMNAYPEIAKNLLISGINQFADQWCEKNASKAWFRGMFNGEALKAYNNAHPEKQ